jgi:hypothetical protein
MFIIARQLLGKIGCQGSVLPESIANSTRVIASMSQIAVAKMIVGGTWNLERSRMSVLWRYSIFVWLFMNIYYKRTSVQAIAMSI